MDITILTVHTTISDRTRERAESALRRLASRVKRAVVAIVRFEEDGRNRRVEIVLQAPNHTRLVAEANDRFFGPALATALHRLEAQVARTKRAPRLPSAKLARA